MRKDKQKHNKNGNFMISFSSKFVLYHLIYSYLWNSHWFKRGIAVLQPNTLPHPPTTSSRCDNMRRTPPSCKRRWRKPRRARKELASTDEAARGERNLLRIFRGKSKKTKSTLFRYSQASLRDTSRLTTSCYRTGNRRVSPITRRHRWRRFYIGYTRAKGIIQYVNDNRI